MQKSAAAGLMRRASLVALATATAMMMTGCGGGDGGGAASTPGTGTGTTDPVPAPVPPPAPTPTNNTPPTISGSPMTNVNVGAAYDLTPSAQDADGDALAFSIDNRPEWATFSTATGRLSGTPQAAGTNANVVISVSDGKNSVALPAFTITVAAVSSAPPPVVGNGVTLSWEVPTQTEDGQNLSDLAGYRIHYGKDQNALTQAIEVQSAGSNTFVVQQLKPGTYYFAVRAVTANGAESALSNVISRQIS